MSCPYTDHTVKKLRGSILDATGVDIAGRWHEKPNEQGVKTPHRSAVVERMAKQYKWDDNPTKLHATEEEAAAAAREMFSRMGYTPENLTPEAQEFIDRLSDPKHPEHIEVTRLAAANMVRIGAEVGAENSDGFIYTPETPLTGENVLAMENPINEHSKRFMNQLDEEQMVAVANHLAKTANRDLKRKDRDPYGVISQEEWEDLCERQARYYEGFDPELAEKFRAEKGNKPRTLIEAYTIAGMPKRYTYAQKNLATECRYIAGLHDVDSAHVKREMDALRREYQQTPPADRPSVPKSYRDAVELSYVYENALKAPPYDNATMYAIYSLSTNPARLEKYRKPREYVVFDTETTGVTNSARILQVTAVVYNPDGTEKERYSTYVTPPKNADGSLDLGNESARKTHGITEEKVAGAPDEVAVARKLRSLMEGRTLVAHNIEFDYGKVQSMFSRTGTPTLPGTTPMIDTLRMARVLQPRPENVDRKEWRHNLESAVTRAGLEFDESKAHDAVYDVDRTSALFQWVRKQLS